ncbi:MAG: hypothetical protein M1831_006667 [Alyxoria varia]|nr:MAG: hypothetical protein M1831_006667 [Alyxoria varia]
MAGAKTSNELPEVPDMHSSRRNGYLPQLGRHWPYLVTAGVIFGLFVGLSTWPSLTPGEKPYLPGRDSQEQSLMPRATLGTTVSYTWTQTMPPRPPVTSTSTIGLYVPDPPTQTRVVPTTHHTTQFIPMVTPTTVGVYRTTTATTTRVVPVQYFYTDTITRTLTETATNTKSATVTSLKSTTEYHVRTSTKFKTITSVQEIFIPRTQLTTVTRNEVYPSAITTAKAYPPMTLERMPLPTNTEAYVVSLEVHPIATATTAVASPVGYSEIQEAEDITSK